MFKTDKNNNIDQLQDRKRNSSELQFGVSLVRFLEFRYACYRKLNHRKRRPSIYSRIKKVQERNIERERERNILEFQCVFWNSDLRFRLFN